MKRVTYTKAEVAKLLDRPYSTICTWCREENFRDRLVIEEVEALKRISESSKRKGNPRCTPKDVAKVEKSLSIEPEHSIPINKSGAIAGVHFPYEDKGQRFYIVSEGDNQIDDVYTFDELYEDFINGNLVHEHGHCDILEVISSRLINVRQTVSFDEHTL